MVDSAMVALIFGSSARESKGTVYAEMSGVRYIPDGKGGFVAEGFRCRCQPMMSSDASLVTPGSVIRAEFHTQQFGKNSQLSIVDAQGVGQLGRDMTLDKNMIPIPKPSKEPVPA
jgi:hypothetical protein